MLAVNSRVWGSVSESQGPAQCPAPCNCYPMTTRPCRRAWVQPVVLWPLGLHLHTCIPQYQGLNPSSYMLRSRCWRDKGSSWPSRLSSSLFFLNILFIHLFTYLMCLFVPTRACMQDLGDNQGELFLSFHYVNCRDQIPCPQAWVTRASVC